MRFKGLIAIYLLLIIGSFSCKALSENDFETHISADLGSSANIDQLFKNVNSHYNVIEHNNENISWWFGRPWISDFAYADSKGELAIGSQKKFAPSIGDKLVDELNIVIDLVNAANGNVSNKYRREAIRDVVYYSRNEKIDSATWNNYGNLLTKSGYYNKSLLFYNRSIQANSSFSEPWNNMGVVLRHLKKYQEAVNCYSKALEISPKNSIFWNNRGESLYQMEKFADALADLNASLNLDQKNYLAIYNKGVVLSRLNRYEEALDCYNRSIVENPYYVSAWNNKGVALAEKGRYKDAVICFKNAIALNQSFAEAWANSGIALKALGSETEAENDFFKSRILGYNNTMIYYKAQTATPTISKEATKRLPWFGTTPMNPTSPEISMFLGIGLPEIIFISVICLNILICAYAILSVSPLWNRHLSMMLKLAIYPMTVIFILDMGYKVLEIINHQ